MTTNWEAGMLIFFNQEEVAEMEELFKTEFPDKQLHVIRSKEELMDAFESEKFDVNDFCGEDASLLNLYDKAVFLLNFCQSCPDITNYLDRNFLGTMEEKDRSAVSRSYYKMISGVLNADPSVFKGCGIQKLTIGEMIKAIMDFVQDSETSMRAFYGEEANKYIVSGWRN